MADVQDNFLVVKFPVSSAAFQAYSELSGIPGVKTAAVVARSEAGQLTVPEHTGSDSHGFWTGSAIGAVIGILGGPLGVLLGWSAGALIGSSADVDHSLDEGDSLAVLSRMIEPGSNILLVEAEEADPGPFDALAGKLSGQVFRIPATKVAAEAAEAHQQAEAAAEAARKARREQRRGEVHNFFHRDH